MRNTKHYKTLPYNPSLKDRAKALRRAGNLSEVLLWNQIKNKNFLNLDFDRQKIIGNYIVDFYCPEKQLILEIDGSSHDNKYFYDAKRQARLEEIGIRFLRFDDMEVKKNVQHVLRVIENYIDEFEKP